MYYSISQNTQTNNIITACGAHLVFFFFSQEGQGKLNVIGVQCLKVKFNKQKGKIIPVGKLEPN